MALSESLCFYLLIGLAVAVTVAVTSDHERRGQRIFQTTSAVLFWPIYLPILLSRSATAEVDPTAAAVPVVDEPHDELSASIAQVENELDGALSSLDGWAEEALAREHDRIAELRTAWRLQAGRIREMDRLLARTAADSIGGEDASDANRRVAQSEQARRANFARLHAVRGQAYADLTATLASVRELVSMIHLAKFTGAPASRADELVTQIAAAVEGLSEVAAWNDASPKNHDLRNSAQISDRDNLSSTNLRATAAI